MVTQRKTRPDVYLVYLHGTLVDATPNKNTAKEIAQRLTRDQHKPTKVRRKEYLQYKGGRPALHPIVEYWWDNKLCSVQSFSH